MRLLVAVDGSKTSLEAVRYAAGVFPPQQTSAVLFHVSTDIPEAILDLERYPDIGVWRSLVKPLAEKQALWMEEFLSRARGLFLSAGFPGESVEVRSQPLQAGVARDILSESRQGYQAVVISRKGAGRLEQLALGSVAQKVAGSLRDIPLVLVGSPGPGRRFLLAVDGSAGSSRAVDFTKAAAVAPGRRVTLFHAVRDIRLSAPGDVSTLSEPDEAWVQDHLRSFRPFLDRVSAELTAAGFGEADIETKVVTMVPSRAGAILEEAKAGGCDTIILGRRGFSDVPEHAMGRVAGKVIQLAAGLTVWLVS
ncbi:MAG: universal stress protein [Thermodesulfobacteriota bacterium]